MEDATLKKYFDDFNEKLDTLNKTVTKIDERQSRQCIKIIEHGKDIQYIKENSGEEKTETSKKFDIVHKKFRREEKLKYARLMAVLTFSGVITAIMNIFVPKSG